MRWLLAIGLLIGLPSSAPSWTHGHVTVTNNFLLLEDASFLLLEDGSKLILE